MSSIYLKAGQGTEEWLRGRSGAITASMASECRKRLKSGANKGDHTKAGHDYAFKLAVERISGEPLDDLQFDPWQARRGRELEPEAREAYERRKCLESAVEQVGLALTEDRRYGASVDGLVGDEGIIEIKCYLSPSKLSAILLSADIGDCMDQIQMGLWVTDRRWADFVLYCPALQCIGRDLTIIRVDRDDDYIDEMQTELAQFDALVESYRARLEVVTDDGTETDVLIKMIEEAS